MRIYVLVALLLYDLFARLQGPAKTVHADLVRHRIQITLPRNIYKGSTFVRHAGAGANNNPATRTETMEVERRLVYRVLRHWTEIARGGRLPRRDEINPYIRDEDAANCL